MTHPPARRFGAGVIVALTAWAAAAQALAQTCDRDPDAPMRVAVVGPSGTSVAGTLTVDGVGVCVLGLSLSGEAVEPWGNEGRVMLPEACLFAGQQLDNLRPSPPDGAFLGTFELELDIIANAQVTRTVEEGEAEFCDVYDAVIEIDDKREARFIAAVG